MSGVRIGVVGAGAWGQNHVRVIAAEPRCVLAAVADPDARARERARRFGTNVALHEDAQRLFVDRTIDAVVIASPAPSHADLATSALAHGKHVLVEKPFALSLAEARRIEAVANDRVAMVGHLMVYHPAVVRLRELLDSGGLGKLHYVHSTRANLGRIRRDENALWSFGPHELSMMDYLLQQSPLSVSATGQCIVQPGIEDVVFLTLQYATGEMAHIHLSWLHPRKERKLTLVCSTKMVEFDDVGTEKLRIFDKGYDRPPEFSQFSEYLTLRDGDVHIPQLILDEPLRLQLTHFLDSIEQGTPPRTGIASGVRIVRALQAAQQSLREGGACVELVEP